MGLLTNRLMERLDNPPLCIACQFGAAHRRTWRTKGKKSGSICRAEKTNPGDGFLVDQIVPDQPRLIPKMSGFITSQKC